MAKNGKSKKGADYDVDPKLKELLERGYASRKAGEEMTKRVGKLVAQLQKKFPNQGKMLRSVLDGQRQGLLAEYEKRKRELAEIEYEKLRVIAAEKKRRLEEEAKRTEGESNDESAGQDGSGS